MIEDSVQIHDNFSVEFKHTFENIFKNKITQYDIITYLFIPSGLNINHQTYTKAKFYNDVKVYIRYKTSEYSTDDLLNLKSGPFKQLKKVVKKVTMFQECPHVAYESKIKLFGAILSHSLEIEKNKIIQTHVVESSRVNLNHLENLKCILDAYRNLMSQITTHAEDEFYKTIIKYGDEYISNVATYHVIELMAFYKKIAEKKEQLTPFIQFVKEEQKYRKIKGYDIENERDNDDESLLYNRSQLKKYMQSVLFLNRDIRKDGMFAEQTFFALAAGLAMIFSTAIAFYYQKFYGAFTLPFFVILVVSYMLKDRIKWLIGLLFIQNANSFFYDYDIKIKDPESNVIGKIKENFIFVPISKLGQKVKKYRLKNRYLEADLSLNGEQIIQYKKKIIIYPKKFGKEIADNRLNSLLDITRFNLQRFTTQMDDPVKTYSLLKKGKIISRTGNKNYHINMIQKLYSENGVEFKRYRMVMNKKGIKRIENVVL